MSIYATYIIHSYSKGEITSYFFLKKSEVGEQKRMYADIHKNGVKMSKIRTYRSPVIRANAGYIIV